MSFVKTLFSIALPIILQDTLTSFVNMLDTIMVGQMGSVEIAAVGLVSEPLIKSVFAAVRLISGKWLKKII